MSLASESYSAYKVFSENLIDHVRSHGTIADTCRSTGINQQQFNKYLSGQVLPSSGNLEKICKHFAVHSQSLFVVGGGDKTQTAFELFKLASKDSVVNGLPAGLYWIYCEIPAEGGALQRILFSVSSYGSIKRIFGMRRPGITGRAMIGRKPSLVEGAAVQNGNRLSIVFRETNNLTRWGMVNIMVREGSAQALQLGILLDFMPWNAPAATPIVTQFITSNTQDLRKYYAKSGYLGEQDFYDSYATDATSLLKSVNAKGFETQQASQFN